MRIQLGVIPAEVLLDRRRKVAMGIELPKGSVELPERGRWQTWPGMLASLGFHVGLFLLATGLLTRSSGKENAATETTAHPERQVAMVYLDPPAPKPAPQPVPEPPPEQSVQEQPRTPPSQKELPPPGPESNEVLSPTPAAKTDPATGATQLAEAPEPKSGTAEQDNVISTDPVVKDGPDDLASATAAGEAPRPTMEEEAQRLFGRPTTGTGNRNNALPWASDSTCIPAPAPPDPNSPVVMDSISGQVFDQTGQPLSGAHLQVVGTKYHTFSTISGQYTLAFDVSLVANCRVQVVRVSAPGYRGRDLYLAMGVGNNNVFMER